ncbi:hypothetical protein TIFTF001_014971 [Ficus carica]|uniref:Uncharacterized protein n=1 Tax=Ficus carica TaxID=3494 RepID=A0AA88D640_FICCA|nr:hypothetical protein TIFTF001_014971 [Ficus carica]
MCWSGSPNTNLYLVTSIVHCLIPPCEGPVRARFVDDRLVARIHRGCTSNASSHPFSHKVMASRQLLEIERKHIEHKTLSLVCHHFDRRTGSSLKGHQLELNKAAVHLRVKGKAISRQGMPSQGPMTPMPFSSVR